MAQAGAVTSGQNNIKPRYDIAVIGAGAAGLSVAYAAARFGLRVALIEQGAMGGECLNAGCIPSKALLAAARRGATWAEAQSHVRAVIAAIAPLDSAERYRALGAVVIKGTARFTGPGRLEVDGVPLLARRIVIATGSRPDIPGFCAALPYITNETVWDLQALPAHLLIIGGGPMAFEMADVFARLGSNVTMAGGSKLLAREDAGLVAPLVAALRGRGVEIIEQRAVAARPGPVLVLADGRELAGSALLVAAGRVSDAVALNLAAAGIAAGPDGIKTDRGLRAVGHKNIFAAGDAADPQGIGPQRFSHIAGYHAGIIIRRALFRLPAKVSPLPPVRVTHTAPELAQAGFTEAQAGAGARVLTAKFAENDRAIADGDTTGLIKLVLDRRSRLVGAGIVGPGAGEMISLYVLAVAHRVKASALAGLVLPYPTRAEAGKRAVGEMFAAKLFSPVMRGLIKALNRLP